MSKISFILFILILWGQLSFSQPPPCSYQPWIDSLIQRVDSVRIAQHIFNLSYANGHFSRVSYTAGNEWAARYIKQEFDSLPGLEAVQFDTFFAVTASPPYDTIPLVNVLAMLPGVANIPHYVFLGGHFDATANLDPGYNWNTDWPTAMAPGADDNATGIAILLELARLLADSTLSGVPFYSIKFAAFGAEERHPAYQNLNHWGSRHYVTRAFNQGDSLVGAYIVDMVGFNDTGHRHFNVVSNTSSTWLGQLLLQVNQTYQIGLHSNSAPFPYATYSDHEQFWQYGYPAVLLIENAPPWQNNPPWYQANPYYHKRTDTPDKLNLSQITALAKLMVGTLCCLSQAPLGISPPERIAQRPLLFPNYPNPFNQQTHIVYELPSASDVTVQIYDLGGRLIATLVKQQQAAGIHRTAWDGTDFRGRPVAIGLYLLRLQTDGYIHTQKMLLLR